MRSTSLLSRFSSALQAFRSPERLQPPGVQSLLLNPFWISAAPWIARAMYVVTKLDVVELLVERPRDIEGLARETNTNVDPLRRVLQALVGCQLFEIDPQGRYHVTQVGEQLHSESPQSLRHWTLLLGENWWDANPGLLECVRTGKSGFEAIFGTSMWEHYEQHPEDRKLFDAAMNEVTLWQSRAIADAIQLPNVQHIVDIGCGRGALLMEILDRHPSLTGTGLDRQTPDESTHQSFQSRGIAERVQFRSGSFFEPAAIPVDGDAYFIKHVLHDWDDQHAERILTACREAMSPDASLYVIEGIRGSEPSRDRLLDWLDIEQMVVTKSGRERNEDDFVRIFRESGFRLHSIHDTSVADASILSASPC